MPLAAVRVANNSSTPFLWTRRTALRFPTKNLKPPLNAQKNNSVLTVNHAPLSESNLSIFQRISQFLGFGKEQNEASETPPEHQYSGSWLKEEKPDYKPDIEQERESVRIIDQQEFIKLREEYKQEAKTAEAMQDLKQEPEPDTGYKLER